MEAIGFTPKTVSNKVKEREKKLAEKMNLKEKQEQFKIKTHSLLNIYFLPCICFDFVSNMKFKSIFTVSRFCLCHRFSCSFCSDVGFSPEYPVVFIWQFHRSFSASLKI